MRKVLFNIDRLIAVLALGIILILGYIGYLAFWPFKTVDLKNDPFPVLNTEPIKAGDSLKYEVDYCRHTDVPAQVTRTLTGPTLITIVQDTATSDVGCRRVVVSNVSIPTHAPTGKYFLKISACYQVTALQNVCHQSRTQDFDVINTELH